MFLLIGCGGNSNGTPSDGTPKVSYSYDTLGRLIKVDYGNSKIIKYTYDKNGNLLKKEKNGDGS